MQATIEGLVHGKKMEPTAQGLCFELGVVGFRV